MKQRHKRKQCLIFKHYRSIQTDIMGLFKPYTTFHEKEGSHESLEVVVDFSLVNKIKSLHYKLQHLKIKYSI